ncbi:UvrD-helicase domain-containing protein [Dactylosporangium sp. CA-052675]|uniref:UvrD-helicase domain-containing protein n=1 Tax=Dactylosporangium sp. CA-052675 TaxID=3239927 RepID=UPI003D94A918
MVLAAAGSRKTQLIIDGALEAPDRRTLITTYTTENLAQITRRLQEARGIVPGNIALLGWFSFLVNQAARPYQAALTGQISYIRSLNFTGQRFNRTPREQWRRFYFDKAADLYRDGVADFACHVDDASNGAVVRRLAAMYDRIYIDELQDLVGYDLDFLDRLFQSGIEIIAVGDPRQHTFSTNNSPRNKQYRGAGLLKWLQQRQHRCTLETRAESWRCNQQICDWADAIYPNMPPTKSHNHELTGHDGVFTIAHGDVPAYIAKYSPTVLRHSRVTPTIDFPALNIGLSKGSTYDRVLIFPTKPMLDYLKTSDPGPLKAPDRLYVAVTRARHSVAFVVDRHAATYIP